MAKIYFISPINGTNPDLFSTFTPMFVQHGYEIVDDINNADMVLFDQYSGLGTYDVKDLIHVLNKKLPIVVFDETDRGGMSKERWWGTISFNKDPLKDWELFMQKASTACKMVYFMRKMDKEVEYPEYVYPFEKCLYKNCDFPLSNDDELFERPYDICWIGNTSPQREHVVNRLIESGFKVYIHWTNEKGKIPHDEWVVLHRRAKMFLTSDGGGFGDERPHQLITVAAMLRQKNNQRFANDWSDMVNCVEVQEGLSTLDVNNLRSVLEDKEKLYNIYLNGIRHMNKYYTEEYRANYILNVIKENI